MFDKLSTRLANVVEGLRGRGRLTEENIGDTLRQVRMALLEADVALPVVKGFIDGVKAKVVGQEVQKSLTPGQALIKIIHDELVRVMGEGVRPLNLRTQPPGHHPAGRLAGRGQDHDGRQTRALADDAREEAGAAGIHGRQASRRNPATRTPGSAA